MNFSTDQWIALAAIAVTIAIAATAGAWTIITAFNRRIDKLVRGRRAEAEVLAAEVKVQAEKHSKELADFSEESAKKREELMKEISLSRHDLRNLIHAEVGELHRRIDQVRAEYMRREDAQELTRALQHLTQRIDGLVLKMTGV